MGEAAAYVAVLAIIVTAWAVSEIIVRVRQKQSAVDVTNRCEISGCDNRSHCTVEKATTTLDVCYSCRDEMTVLFGWTESHPLREEAS